MDIICLIYIPLLFKNKLNISIMKIVKSLIVFNGIYDIFCGISIILFFHTNSPNTFACLHPTIFVYNKELIHPIFYRMLAYWIITYGMVRIMYFYDSKYIRILVSLTYLLEASVFGFEFYCYESTLAYKTLWVSSSSFVLSYISLIHG